MVLDDLREACAKSLSRRLGEYRGKVEGFLARLDALNPAGVLQRGYSMARKIPGGEVIKDAGEVSPGEDIEVRLARGVIECKVSALRDLGIRNKV